jgi:serine-protein kinase ATM
VFHACRDRLLTNLYQHQLCARLSWTDQCSSQKSLQRLMLRMCKEHPFHSMYQLFCLTQSSAPTPSKGHATTVGRRVAAQEILDKLSTDTENVVRQRTQEIHWLCKASLQWATYPIKTQDCYKKGGNTRHDVPAVEIKKIKNLKIPVMTMSIPVDPTLRYDDCVCINGYENKFQTAGGINLPKIIVCIGSDGRRYKQLVCWMILFCSTRC